MKYGLQKGWGVGVEGTETAIEQQSRLLLSEMESSDGLGLLTQHLLDPLPGPYPCSSPLIGSVCSPSISSSL